MVTVKITSEKTLDTPDDIASYLEANYAGMMARATLLPGDVVTITSRAGVIPDIGIGDVGVVLLSEPAPSPFTHVRLLHTNGSIMTMQLQTANLAKRAAS